MLFSYSNILNEYHEVLSPTVHFWTDCHENQFLYAAWKPRVCKIKLQFFLLQLLQVEVTIMTH